MAKKSKSMPKTKKITEVTLNEKDTNKIGLGEPLIAFFTAFIIIITRMHTYERPMDQFFWSTGNNVLNDFFSYYKMVAILICATLALLVLLFRLMTETLRFKKSYIYIPMLVYTVFVVLSYVFSDYKEFALLGYNDRFEGTLTLISYMIMLFFVINTVHSEKRVKWVVYPLAISSALLGLLGLSQALDMDFFRTTIGKKLITPHSFWENLDSLEFTFQHREIYQTVYNINYVSFYLTLLMPLFGLLFIREKRMGFKIAYGALFALLLYNLIGSKSSGGILGLAVSVIIATIVLNRRIIDWKKPVLVLLAIFLVITGITYDRWMPEITGAARSVIGDRSQAIEVQESNDPTHTETSGEVEGSQSEVPNKEPEVEPGSVKPHIGYIETHEDSIVMDINGEPLTVNIIFNDDRTVRGFTLTDKAGELIAMQPIDEDDNFSIEDERFRDYAKISYAIDKNDKSKYYVLIDTGEMQWPFAITKQGVFYTNQLGNMVALEKVPHIGWEDNLRFGSGRGYIWSRTLPMLKETIFLGHGADTYCIYFPHHDYAGKFSADWNINKIVDKPHNMYMGIAIGTGMISLLALLALWGAYLVQSFRLYFRANYENLDFNTYVGVGIFLGICGFLTAALVNDSSVSVMPMFYGLLGTGIAINMMLKDKAAND